VRRGGFAEADSLDGLEPDELASRASAIAARLPEPIGETVLFAADVVALSRGRRPEEYDVPADAAGSPTAAAIAANVAFVSAHVAGVVDPRGYDAGVADERAWQLAWLRERLGLAA